MLTNSVHAMTARPAATASWRRDSHGSTAFSTQLSRLQPQDGAPVTPSKIASISERLNPLLGAEPEDARLTGSTRSLFRRVLGLNVRKAAPPQRPLALATTRKPQSIAAPITPQAQVA